MGTCASVGPCVHFSLCALWEEVGERLCQFVRVLAIVWMVLTCSFMRAYEDMGEHFCAFV